MLDHSRHTFSTAFLVIKQAMTLFELIEYRHLYLTHQVEEGVKLVTGVISFQLAQLDVIRTLKSHESVYLLLSL
jgi:hypothetical protein